MLSPTRARTASAPPAPPESSATTMVVDSSAAAEPPARTQFLAGRPHRRLALLFVPMLAASSRYSLGGSHRDVGPFPAPAGGADAVGDD